MAWISVDQKLIGGKLRTLHKAIGCSRNEAIGILVTLWLWGIDNTETDGLISSADRGDIAEVLRSGISENLDADVVVDCLIENRWIDDVSGHLYIHDWSKWRSYYNRYVKDKQSNSERQARYKAKHSEEDNGESNVMNNVTDDVPEKQTDHQESETETGKKMSQKEKQEAKHGKDFEEFWSIYPKKVDKGEAFKKYKARRNDGYSAEEILEAAKAYKSQCEKNHTDKQYIKHAKTFLGPSLPFVEYIPKDQQKHTSEQSETPASGIRSL